MQPPESDGPRRSAIWLPASHPQRPTSSRAASSTSMAARLGLFSKLGFAAAQALQHRRPDNTGSPTALAPDNTGSPTALAPDNTGSPTTLETICQCALFGKMGASAIRG